MNFGCAYSEVSVAPTQSAAAARMAVPTSATEPQLTAGQGERSAAFGSLHAQAQAPPARPGRAAAALCAALYVSVNNRPV